MNIIITAVVTIIVSIISGLLVEYFKNLAPRILCSVENGVPVKINNQKVYVYSITVSNLSKKIIHELTLNIQSPQSGLKVADAKITKGLKFNYSAKDNVLDIDIPFLSKGDKFSVTVYVENQYGLNNKPVIVMRSPENFKEVGSAEQKKSISSLFNMPQAHKSKKPGKNKKAVIVAAAIILLIAVAGLLKFYLTGKQIPGTKTDIDKHAADIAKPSERGTTKNDSVKAPAGETTENTGTNTSSSETTKNTSTNPSTGRTSGNTSTNTSSGETSGSTGTKASTGGTAGNTDTKTSAGGTAGNTSINTSAEGKAGNTTVNKTANGAVGNSSN